MWIATLLTPVDFPTQLRHAVGPSFLFLAQWHRVGPPTPSSNTAQNWLKRTEKQNAFILCAKYLYRHSKEKILITIFQLHFPNYKGNKPTSETSLRKSRIEPLRRQEQLQFSRHFHQQHLVRHLAVADTADGKHNKFRQNYDCSNWTDSPVVFPLNEILFEDALKSTITKMLYLIEHTFWLKLGISTVAAELQDRNVFIGK